ncbi:Beta-galactosidase C-terminal domain [Actinomyces faecalis]|uniref:Beta-galactosidase C-terminal domain n=1 Tax=Actinomyces faecalis TaxID=2722820 RepID=UPI0015533249|nr:Beta-galactosidase C-terminal domain [Actinomyces faecalis]
MCAGPGTGLASPLAGLIEAPEGVELAVRRKDERQWLFVLNYQDEPQVLRLPAVYTDLLSGASEQVEVEPYGVRIYEL